MNDNNKQPINASTSNINNNNGQKLLILLVIFIAVFGTTMAIKKEKIDNKTNNYIEEGISYDKDGDFLFAVEDTYIIASDIMGAIGKIERGTIKTDDEIQIIGMNKEIKIAKVLGASIGEKNLDYVEAGNEEVSIAIRSVKPNELIKGQVLAKPNSIQEAKTFDATIELYSKKDVGRIKPIFTGHNYNYYFRTTEINGIITLPEGIEKITPGEKGDVSIKLNKSVAMEVGTRFHIRHEGQNIGVGIVTNVY